MTVGPRIVVVDTAESHGRDLSVEKQNFPSGCSVQQFTYRDDPEKLADFCSEANAVITDYAVFSREVLLKMPHCSLISVAATGFDGIDIKAAKELGISVCSVGEYCTGEVADHTMALILALNRKLFNYHKQVQEHKNWTFTKVTGVSRLAGQNLGIIGFGRIGRAVASRAAAFGLNVMAFDPYQNDYKAGARLVEFDELLRKSDIISLHANLSTDNASLIDGSAFLKMDRRPQLVNVARGGLIDEKALVYALDNRLISGAALDVLADEPPKLKKHPLLGRENVILTPHVAFYSDQALFENRKISALNIKHFMNGRFDQVFRFVHHAQAK
jgi:lactate dehydrogenase-like 2-hydroxyacid dehydrogenase